MDGVATVKTFELDQTGFAESMISLRVSRIALVRALTTTSPPVACAATRAA